MPNPSTRNPRGLAVVGTCGECMFWCDYGNLDGLCLCPKYELNVTRYCKDSCPQFNQASGLTWEPMSLSNPRYDIQRGGNGTRIWMLISDGVEVGFIRKFTWSAEWNAFVNDIKFSIEHGSLADCARALVAKVRDRG